MVKRVIQAIVTNFTLIFLSFCHAIISVFSSQGVEFAQKVTLKLELNTIEAFIN
ncbi:hypothetical protein ACWOFR_01830 [Carnobacterium gallinarum]|uniref:hypothetical protein n=1 Tax=Carnobacterium gallinarum TaxID=2749 RepID=UPI000ACD79C5|nr:hypothetical protein [Carnobacterium gallinarum]